MERELLVCADCGGSDLTFSGTKVYTDDKEEDFGDDIWFCQDCQTATDFIAESEWNEDGIVSELLKSDENITIYKLNTKIIIYNIQSGIQHTIDLKDDEYYSES